MEPVIQLRAIVELLLRFHYRFATEQALRDGIAEVLTAGNFTFEREFIASASERFDFLVVPGIVIEAKVDGSLSTALYQVDRYAALPDVRAVLLASTCRWADTTVLPDRLRGKPLRLVHLHGAAF